MTKQQKNKLVMMKSLLSYLKLNRAIWENSVPFTAAVTELEDLIASIETTWQSTDVDQSGLVAEKRKLKASLVNTIFAISSQMYAMASKTKDMVLQRKVNFTKSELDSMRDGELPTAAKTVSELARAILNDLISYDVTADGLDTLDELTKQYNASLSVPRNSVSERSANNVKIKGLFSVSGDLLNKQLKPQMIRYEIPNPEFYFGYLNASKIVDYGTRHEKPEEEVAP